MFNNKKQRDMRFNNYIKTKLPFFVVLGFSFILVSCGSYQYVSSDSDGIYGEREIVYQNTENTTETPVEDETTNNCPTLLDPYSDSLFALSKKG